MLGWLFAAIVSFFAFPLALFIIIASPKGARQPAGLAVVLLLGGAEWLVAFLALAAWWGLR